MGLSMIMAMKCLELAIHAIEAGIADYDAVTGKDIIGELEAHFGKLAMIISSVKAAAPAVEAAVAASAPVNPAS